VKEMFERAVGKPVRVELTESIKRGGKACRFVVRV
jgi:predicted hydrocarbon binding protein